MSISIITLNAQFITRLFLIWRKDLLQSASWNAISGYYWNHHLRWTEDSTSEENYIFLTKHIYFSGLPGAPEDCRVSRETNDSLTVLCTPGWSGGLPQTFHLGKNKTKYFRLWPKVFLKFTRSSLLKASWVLSRQTNTHRFWLLELLLESKHSYIICKIYVESKCQKS